MRKSILRNLGLTKKTADIKYVVAAMPRSGSNLLVRQLAKAGVGIPGEYFSPHAFDEDHPIRQKGGFDKPEHANYVRDQFTDQNGVLGIKFHWDSYWQVRENTDPILKAGAKFLFTRRRDLATQAMSFETARASGKWDPRWPVNAATIQPGANPEDLDCLESTARIIVNEEHKWHAEIIRLKAERFDLYYEDYLQSPVHWHREINKFIGVSPRNIPTAEPAPANKTGSNARQLEIISELRERLRQLDADRLPLTDSDYVGR